MGYEMARGEARTWNYMSDFELDITLQQDGESMTIPEGVPFVVTVTGACGEYRASYDGRRYINCAVNGDTIRVFCNNHMLGVGRLMVDVWLKYEDVNYPDGKDIHLVEDTGCALVRGNGNADGSMKVELALQYAVVTAYEVAAAKGYKGTEEAFYKSLAEVTDNSTAAKDAAAKADKAAATALQAGEDATTTATEAGAAAKKTAEDAAAKAETAVSKAKKAAAKAEDAAASATETAATVSAEVASEIKASKQVRETLQEEEAKRETAENARVLSEQERRNAETKRATDFANAISATETAGEDAKKTAEDAAAKANTAATNANGIYTTVRTAYESGEFKGEKGDKGDTGDKGENALTLTAESLCYGQTGNADKCGVIIGGRIYGYNKTYTLTRGINLLVFSKDEFSLLFFKAYDTYARASLCNDLAAKMDEYTDHVVVLIADDACACTQTLRDKIAAYGGKTEGVWTAANYSWYFVGMAGLTSGQGYESYYKGLVLQKCTIPLIPGKGFVLNGAKGEAGGYLPVYEHGGGETLLTLDTNTEHQWTEVPSLKLTFGAVGDNTIGNEIRVAFKSGDTATTVTLPAGIVWAVPFIVPTNALVEMSFTYVGGKWLGVWTSFDV